MIVTLTKITRDLYKKGSLYIRIVYILITCIPERNDDMKNIFSSLVSRLRMTLLEEICQ